MTTTPAPGLRDTLAAWLRTHALADLEDETTIDSLTHTVWRIIEPALTQRDAQITAIHALHVRNANTGDCEHCSERDYPDYAVPWPCPTIRALDAKPLPAAGPEAEYEALKARFLEAVARNDQPTVLEPDPAREARVLVQAVTREQLHDAIRTLARTDPEWWRTELGRMARIHRRRFL